MYDMGRSLRIAFSTRVRPILRGQPLRIAHFVEESQTTELRSPDWNAGT